MNRYRLLFILLFLWTGICLVLFDGLYRTARKQGIDELNSRQSIHIRQAAASIDRFFDQWVGLLEKTAGMPSIIHLDESGKKVMAFILESQIHQIHWISRVDRFGRIEYTYPYDSNLIGADLSGQKHVRKILETHRPVLSSLFRSVQGFDAMALHVPVFSSTGDFAGSIGVFINFEVIGKHYLETIRVGQTGYAWMVDQEGIELYCPVPGHVGNSVFENCREFPTILSMAREMVQGREGVTTYLFDKIRGEHREPVLKHAVYAPIPIVDTYWSIVVASSEEEILGAITQFRNSLLGVIALLFIGALLFSYYGMKAWGIVHAKNREEKAQEALRRNEELLNAVVETARDSIFVKDLSLRYLRVNHAMATLFGMKREDIIGLRDSDLFGAEVADETEGEDRRVLAGETVEMQLSKPVRGEIRYFHTIKVPLKDSSGGTTGLCGIARDITAQKAAELEREKLQLQLIQSQKMDSIGKLAGGVAHDFNNMLNVILGYTELAMEKTGPDDPIRADLAEALSAARRSSDITGQLLAFARKQVISPQLIDLNPAVEGCLKMIVRLIGEDIRVDWKPGGDLWPILLDLSQLDQILTNLCVNARDAISGHGRILIRTENITIDAPHCPDIPALLSGDYVVLSVQDDGEGIDPAALTHIFEPFFTTKDCGKGTGLGLATVYGIVKQNNGHIDVDSVPGRGTTFRLYFPKSESSDMSKQRERVDPPRSGRGETVLIVEDEAVINRLVQEMLEGLGYQTISVQSPAEAIDSVTQYPGSIDLMVTDVVMPGMNGYQLAQRLAVVKPRMKFLYMSGYTDAMSAHDDKGEKEISFLQKPFSKTELAFKVREVLDGDSGRISESTAG